jgi:methionyl-tRNA formyltransferase
MGTSEFGLPTLEQIKNNFNLLAIVTNYDKPSGRGLKIKNSAVKEYALKKNIELLQPKNLKDQNFIEKIKKFKPDFIIVVAFRMLPKVIWSIPKHGTINLHASLLPNYRGAAPINWALINGEKFTGVTTFFIDDEIDTGDILLQKKIKINKTDNAEDLHKSLSKTGSLLMHKTINRVLNNSIKPSRQESNKDYKTAYKLNKENIKINWETKPIEIYNKIRGLSPYPGARTTIIDAKLKTKKNIIIYDCDYKLINNKLNPGHIIISKKDFKISCVDGYIMIKDIKIEGKKRMKIKSFLNGFNGNNELLAK